MTRFEVLEDFAPLAYATLPITIGLFVWRYDWAGGGSTPAAGSGGSAAT